MGGFNINLWNSQKGCLAKNMKKNPMVMASTFNLKTSPSETGYNQLQVEQSELWRGGATNLLYWNHENLR